MGFIVLFQLRERLDWAESEAMFSFFFFFFLVPAALFDQVKREQCTDALFMGLTNFTFQPFFH